MTRLRILSLRPGLVAAFALAVTAAGAATIPSSTPGTRATPSPDQPDTHDGDYDVEEIGETTIRARCHTGGWVFVAAQSSAGAAASAASGRARAKGITEDRDAAIRSACRDIDFSK